MLVHTGLRNPGVAAVIRRHRKRWERCPTPVIAHVVGVSVEETINCVDHLSRLEVVAGVELGLPDSLTVEDALDIVISAHRACAPPLIVKLPLWRASDLAARIADLGVVDALTVAAPPRGTVWHQGRAVTGRLYGPAMFPQALWVLRQVAALTTGTVPLIGCGGIHTAHDALAMLDAGAVAVQIDGYVWKDPTGFVQLTKTVANAHKESDAPQP
jgi:dihydroorotate dehydrogenase (NAD+) catalytic subunit